MPLMADEAQTPKQTTERKAQADKEQKPRAPLPDKPLSAIVKEPVVPAAAAEQGTEQPKTGRPSSFTQDIADRICDELSDGKSLRKVCEAEDMPSKVTVLKWLRDNQDFLTQYTRAKEESADSLADDIEAIAEGVLTRKYDPNSARVAMDGKKWVASKLKPKKYGDKLDLTTGNEKLNRGMTDAELDAILARERKAADKASQSPQTR